MFNKKAILITGGTGSFGNKVADGRATKGLCG